MKFKLLIFDWDGTLMDSEARIVACVKAAVADLGVACPADDAISDIIGLGLKEAVTKLFPGADDAFHLALVTRYRIHFLDESRAPSPMFEGAREVLEHLSQSDYLLAVATGKGRSGLDKVLSATGLGSLFHATRCADETFSKPHPQMLEEILDELGVKAHEALMIGDTEYDLQMAANAGMPALGVSYGVHEPDRFMRHNPLGCLDAITDLPHRLQELEHDMLGRIRW